MVHDAESLIAHEDYMRESSIIVHLIRLYLYVVRGGIDHKFGENKQH